MIDPVESALEAGLKYVTDKNPGIRRLRRGKGFTYHDDHSGKVTCPTTMERIKSLVIPPAWEDVWICRHTTGHLQATGRDARKRKQYRYHEKWNLQRNQTKFDRLQDLSLKMPVLKERIALDLKRPGLPREKVLAAVIQVMLVTQSRVGNAAYAQENESYGVTTLLNEHADVKGTKVHLSFVGKSKVNHDIYFQDPVVSKIIKRCQELPGEELFAYQDDSGQVVDVTSTHVNEYLKEITGEDFTAKDLRTWGGSCKAIEILVQNFPGELTERKWKERHVSVVKETALHLHNTVAICRKYYVHPRILEADRNGTIFKIWKKCRRSGEHFSREEKLLLNLLKTRP